MKSVIYILLFTFMQASVAFAQTSKPDYDKLTAEVCEMFKKNMQLH
jgi:hypothetical protein